MSAVFAGSHTSGTEQKSSSGVFMTALLVSFVGIMAWAYQAIRPPRPKIPGSPGGPDVTAPRIKLRDGRNLAYKEYGVPMDKAKYKIVYINGHNSCRHDVSYKTSLSPDFVEGLGIYFVSFDRPGYGESDPDPDRTSKSTALDIEELADQLGLGPKFYVIGISLGGQVAWACLNYIPHRLAGVALVVPLVNYWWRNLPAKMAEEAFSELTAADKWGLRVAHYAPWLTYWWNTQKWFPVSNIISGNLLILSPPDKQLLPQLEYKKANQAYTRQQGDYESIHRDMIVAFGSWELDPLDLRNPFPNNNGSVHLWQGDEDILVSMPVQRYIAKKLPWIRYHEIHGFGHLISLLDGMVDKIVKTLLVGEEE